MRAILQRQPKVRPLLQRHYLRRDGVDRLSGINNLQLSIRKQNVRSLLFRTLPWLFCVICPSIGIAYRFFRPHVHIV